MMVIKSVVYGRKNKIKQIHSFNFLLNSERSRVFIKYHWSVSSLHAISREFPNTQAPPKSDAKIYFTLSIPQA